MDISFYILLTLACMVLLLAMWACAASSTMKWGPDLTLELPPHVLQEALFGTRKDVNSTGKYKRDPLPSAPSELPYAPLLSNEQPMGISKPPMKTFGFPSKAFSPSSSVNMNAPVLVLPPRIAPQHKVKPVFYKFSTEEPA